jgi:hypothetical protein
LSEAPSIADCVTIDASKLVVYLSKYVIIGITK